MKTTLLSLLFLYFVNTSAQLTDTSYIRTHATPISDREDPGARVYERLKDYRVILVGELHGTVEPAEFIIGIAKAFRGQNKKVIIGMEIPATSMQEFIDSGTEESLAKTRFFLNGKKWGANGDGRPNKAWAHLLLTFKDNNVVYTFFDETKTQAQAEGKDRNRDSLMYENINGALIANPDAVFIGLCGNYHNLLHIRDGHHSAAWYLKHASNTSLMDTTKLLSLDFIYDSGSANVNTSPGEVGGLRIHTYAKGQSGEFGTANSYENYLLIGEGHPGYSGILFTRTVHASLLFVK